MSESVRAKPPTGGQPLCPIVAFGASAGGLKACQELLESLPANLGPAYVFILHLDPRHVSMLGELLSKHTRMPVIPVKDRTRVEPNRVYVIPPNMGMRLSAGRLLLAERSRSGPPMPIDEFFRSLAEEQGSRAIAVILSGTASDGTLGVKAIKAAGGGTMAQDQTARYDAMPRNAIATGCVDLILPPRRIAEEIVRLCRGGPPEREPPQPGKVTGYLGENTRKPDIRVRQLRASLESERRADHPAVFEKQRTATKESKRAAGTARRIRDLEDELKSTRQYLDTLIEEHQAATEELKSANEEVQSSNEELQNTNEELTSVNQLLETRNAELSQTNNDLTNLLTSVCIPIVMLDHDLRIRRFTPQAERVLNLRPTDIGRPLSDFQPKIDIPDLEQLCLDVIASLGATEREVRDREGRWFSMWLRPYRTAENQIDGLVIALFDITDRKEAEGIRAKLACEMETRQRILESIIQNAPAAIALLRGPEFTVEMLNPAYQALAQGKAMAGRTVAEVWPEAAHLVIPLLQVAHDAQTVYHADSMRFPLRRGPDSPIEERYFNFSYVPLPGLREDGEVQILVVAIEVTAERKASRELHAAYEELAAIHANAPVALLLVDEEFRVQKMNDVAAQFAGRPAIEMQGLRYGEALGCLNALADPRGCGYGEFCAECPIRLAVGDTLASAARHQDVESWETYSIGGRLQERCLLASTASIQSNGRRRALVCLQDITERKRTARQLESALEEKTVLLKEIHHRVKNNLAVIASLLSMKAAATSNSEVRLALESSQERVASMALIHEHLYSSSYLDRIDFSEYAQGLVQRLQAALLEEPAPMAIELSLDPIEIGIERAVPCALILNELLTNAIKYAFPAGRQGVIRVSLRRAWSGLLELAIEDDGIGLPAGQLGQANAESLGLHIVGILTRQLEGSIEQQPCSGTRIVIRFPE